jgi:hypothetical protein
MYSCDDVKGLEPTNRGTVSLTIMVRSLANHGMLALTMVVRYPCQSLQWPFSQQCYSLATHDAQAECN